MLTLFFSTLTVKKVHPLLKNKLRVSVLVLCECSLECFGFLVYSIIVYIRGIVFSERLSCLRKLVCCAL
jgi:hypothetical protein